MNPAQAFEQSVFRYLDTLADRLPAFVGALLLFGLFWVAARVTRSSVQRVMARTSTEGHVDFVVGRLAYVGILTVGVVAALGVLGVSITALATGLGVAGFALGFAFKDVLGNLLAGILVLFQRPFTVGDSVRIEAHEGVVEDIRIRDTVLRDYDGTLIYLPNSTVYGSPIVNLSAAAHRRADVRLPVALDSDVSTAVEAARTALAESATVLSEPEPVVLVDTLTEGAVTLICRFWVDQSVMPFQRSRSRAAAALKAAMDDSGVRLRRSPMLFPEGG